MSGYTAALVGSPRINGLHRVLGALVLAQLLFIACYDKYHVDRRYQHRGSENAPIHWKWAVCDLAKLGGHNDSDYGSWLLCDNQIRRGGITYSFGIGVDVSFDNAMVERGGKVFGYDPTIPTPIVEAIFPRQYQKSQPRNFQFRRVGLASAPGVLVFHELKDHPEYSKSAVDMRDLSGDHSSRGRIAPVLDLPTFMCSNGHSYVDVLKMDVEGVEFGVCEWLGKFDGELPFGQILIEYHDRFVKSGRAKVEACRCALARKGFTEVYLSPRFEEAAYARMADNFVFS